MRGFQLLVSRDKAHSRAVFSYLSGTRLILAVTMDLMRARGVPMCALCEPPDPVQAGQVAMHPAPPGRGDLASAGCGSRDGETRGAARLPRYRVLAAGAAVTVALCLSLAGTIRVMPLRAMPGNHVVRAMALVRFADDNPGCPPALGPGRWDESADRAHSAPRPGLSRASVSIDPGQPGDRATLIRAPGADRASTGPDMACLPAYREFPVRHLPVSSWWRFPGVRPANVTLTARTPIPGPHAGSRHGNAISDHGRDGTKRPGAASGDRGHDGIRLVSHVGPGRQDSLARGWAPGASGGIPPGCVPPGAGGQDVAAGPAVRGCKACGEIGGTGGNLGCGDRASLPGRPARYRMIWLVCARCGAETPQLFYDERDLPVCAGSAEEPHGRMELRQ